MGDTQQFQVWKKLLWFLFPPYGLFVLFFKSRLKWYIKVPVSLVILLILTLSVDQVLNPYRVEDADSQKIITQYVSKHMDDHMGSVRKVSREGTYPWNNKSYIVYRTLTTLGLYDFVIQANQQGTHLVNGIYQTYPSQVWKKQSSGQLDAPPMAMVYFYKKRSILGAVKNVEHVKNELKLVTTKGNYRYVFQKDKVTEIDKEDGEVVLNQKNQYDIDPVVTNYFGKREKKLGKIEGVYGYDMDSQKESFYIRTDKGIYRVDRYDNGNIQLLQANNS